MLPSVDMFGYEIYTFSVFLLLGVIFGNWIFARAVRKRFAVSEWQLIIIQTMLAVSFMAGGWLGNAILYSMTADEPFGGYSIMGSILLLSLAAPLAARAAGLSNSGRTLADMVSVSFLPAQIIGKFACLAAGCCYGTEWHGPFAITFHGNSPAPPGIPLHAVQIYEAIGLFLLWILCRWILRNTYAAGLATGVFLVGKGAERFLAELVRGDMVMTDLGISTAQIASLLCIGGGVAYILLRRPVFAAAPVPSISQQLGSLEKT